MEIERNRSGNNAGYSYSSFYHVMYYDIYLLVCGKSRLLLDYVFEECRNDVSFPSRLGGLRQPSLLIGNLESVQLVIRFLVISIYLTFYNIYALLGLFLGLFLGFTANCLRTASLSMHMEISFL